MSGQLTRPLVYVFSFLVTTGYFIFFEARSGGATPGKRALGLRVLRDDGLRPTFAQTVIRNLLRVIDWLPGLYATAAVTALLDGRGRRLGDLAAGTMVVAQPRAVRPEAPAREDGAGLGAGPGFREAVARELTVEERDLVLSAVLRREELMLPARVGIFGALADRLAPRLGIPRPPHLSHERYVCEIARVVS